MATIKTRIEGKRGCGYRKPGGLYLMCDGPGRGCGKLPIPLVVCPCCGNGIKPSRGWTWINGTQIAAEHPCGLEGSQECDRCPLAEPMGRVGLIWIGEAHYKRPVDFTREADAMGISRRISTVPRDFVLGETWVWLAHRKTIENADGSYTPAVFRAFRPQRIEYVVKGTESEDELERLSERGITLVRVEKPGQTKPLFS